MLSLTLYLLGVFISNHYMRFTVQISDGLATLLQALDKIIPDELKAEYKTQVLDQIPKALLTDLDAPRWLTLLLAFFWPVMAIIFIFDRLTKKS